MTKLYYYTSANRLARSLEVNSLRSDFAEGAYRSAIENKVAYDEAYKKLRELALNSIGDKKIDLMILERRTYIHLLRHKDFYADGKISQNEYKNSTMVVLGFDCPDNLFEEDIGENRVKIKDELSLDYLTEIYAQALSFQRIKIKLIQCKKRVPLYFWDK